MQIIDTHLNLNSTANDAKCFEPVLSLSTEALTVALGLWYLRVSHENPPVKSLSVSSTDFWGSTSTRPSSTPTTSATGTETSITQTSGTNFRVQWTEYFNHYPQTSQQIFLLIMAIKAQVALIRWILAASHLGAPTQALSSGPSWHVTLGKPQVSQITLMMTECHSHASVLAHCHTVTLSWLPGTLEQKTEPLLMFLVNVRAFLTMTSKLSAVKRVCSAVRLTGTPEKNDAVIHTVPPADGKSKSLPEERPINNSLDQCFSFKHISKTTYCILSTYIITICL